VGFPKRGIKGRENEGEKRGASGGEKGGNIKVHGDSGEKISAKIDTLVGKACTHKKRAMCYLRDHKRKVKGNKTIALDGPTQSNPLPLLTSLQN